MFSRELVSAPQAIVIDPDTGDAYVTAEGDLMRIEGASNGLPNAKITSYKSTINLGAPAGIVMIGNVIWFTDKSRKQVRSFTPTSATATLDFAFGQEPGHLAKDHDHNLWIADTTGRTVGILKANSIPGDSLFSATLKGNPNDLLIDHSDAAWALVTDTASDSVHVAKLIKSPSGNDLTPIVDKEVELAALKRGTGLAIDDQNVLWVTAVTTGGKGHLMNFDSSNGSSTANFNLEFIPGRFAIRGGFAWIPDVSASGNQIHKVSLATGAVIKSYSLGGKGVEVFEDSSGDLWVPLESNPTIVKLDF
jgi:DNA-binding beta-propeller fold protein YncE